MKTAEQGSPFTYALTCLREGAKAYRLGWNNSEIYIKIQHPDKDSKMTEPYIYMVKGKKKFPCDLSCESILADDWMVVV